MIKKRNWFFIFTIHCRWNSLTSCPSCLGWCVSFWRSSWLCESPSGSQWYILSIQDPAQVQLKAGLICFHLMLKDIVSFPQFHATIMAFLLAYRSPIVPTLPYDQYLIFSIWNDSFTGSTTTMLKSTTSSCWTSATLWTSVSLYRLRFIPKTCLGLKWDIYLSDFLLLLSCEQKTKESSPPISGELRPVHGNVDVSHRDVAEQPGLPQPGQAHLLLPSLLPSSPPSPFPVAAHKPSHLLSHRHSPTFIFSSALKPTLDPQ